MPGSGHKRSLAGSASRSAKTAAAKSSGTETGHADVKIPQKKKLKISRIDDIFVN
jgi:hypothetical protein